MEIFIIGHGQDFDLLLADNIETHIKQVRDGIEYKVDSKERKITMLIEPEGFINSFNSPIRKDKTNLEKIVEQLALLIKQTYMK